MVQRARLVLLAAEGASNSVIADAVGLNATSVGRWRARFVAQGVAGLVDQRHVPAGRRGRPLAPITVSEEQREVLGRWCRRPKTAAGLAMRARIVLAATEGLSNQEVARRLGCNSATVTKWRRRFVERGLVGLSDEYRSGRPRTISDDQVDAVITKTLEELPADGSTHWSTRSMAQAVGLSQTAISKMWRAFGLKPHRVDTFKISTDPNFVDKIHDVVGLYLNPPERAIVLCVDEKTGIQALDRTQPRASPRSVEASPMRSGDAGDTTEVRPRVP
jgi:transposase